MISALVRISFFVILLNVFLALTSEAFNMQYTTTLQIVNLTQIQEEVNATSEYSQLQPFAYFTYLTLVQAWNILMKVITSIFLTGTLMRQLIPIIPTEVETAINAVMSVVVVIGLVEFLRGMRL